MAAASDIDADNHRVSPPPAPPLRPRTRHTLPRRASLKRRRLIRALFDRSRTDVHTTAAGCVRLLARLVPPDEAALPVPVQVAFAPGRGLRAVARNRIKRHLREAYRHHQHDLVALLAGHSAAMTLVVLFRGRAADARTCIPRDLPRALQRLAAHYRTILPQPPEDALQVT